MLKLRILVQQRAGGRGNVDVLGVEVDAGGRGARDVEHVVREWQDLLFVDVAGAARRGQLRV